MARQYLYNTKTGRLHIKGYCPSAKGLTDFKPFSVLEDVYSFARQPVVMCKKYQKILEKKLEGYF